LEAVDVVYTFNMIRWILFAVSAAILRGLSPIFIRTGAKRADPSFAAALFSTMLLVIYFIPILLNGEQVDLFAVSNRELLFTILGGTLAAFACLCLFTALTGTGVNRVFPLINLSSVFVIVLGHFLFGESLGLWRICCIILILLGTVLIESRTHPSGSLRWLFYVFFALLLMTALPIINKAYLPATITTSFAQLLRTAFACVLLWIFAFARGRQKTARSMRVKGWISVLLAACCIGLALVCDIYGARLGDWSWLSPIRCLSFASMLLFARIFLKEKLSGSAVFGMLLVLFGTFAILMGW